MISVNTLIKKTNGQRVDSVVHDTLAHVDPSIEKREIRRNRQKGLKLHLIYRYENL
jgi:RNase P/RNase MRP subunit p30